ncbi:MAG TPA: hypothetical protein VGB64_07910 [Actinomycetota bacterium]
MRGSKLIALVAVALATMIMGAAGAAEPSAACNGGAVPPGTTPLGVGINQTGDPAGGPATVKACNTGSTVPAPAKGTITVQGDANAQKGFVDVDGDSNNAGAPCTDGYVRVAASAGGPAFYESANGGWTSTAPAKSPDTWAQNIANSCAGPLPAP